MVASLPTDYVLLNKTLLLYSGVRCVMLQVVTILRTRVSYCGERPWVIDRPAVLAAHRKADTVGVANELAGSSAHSSFQHATPFFFQINSCSTVLKLVNSADIAPTSAISTKRESQQSREAPLLHNNVNLPGFNNKYCRIDMIDVKSHLLGNSFTKILQLTLREVSSLPPRFSS